MDDLAAFVSVYELRSFAAAGRALRVDASAVSRRVKALEDRLGVRLLHRSTRRVSPTDAGEELYDRVSPALHALREAELEVGRGAHALRGTIRVSAPGAFGRWRIAPAVFRFVAEHREVRVDLRLSDARVDLLQERIDLAIRIGEPREPGLVVRRLGTSLQVAAAAPAYLAARPFRGTLDGHDVVLREERGATLDDAPTLPDGSGKPDWRVALTADDVDAAAAAVRAGLGIGLLPWWLVEAELARGELVAVQGPFGGAPVYAVLVGGRKPPRRVVALLEHLAGVGPTAP